MKAKFVWNPFANGGKKEIPPLNVKYYPMVKLHKKDDFLSWSIVVCNEEILSQYETMGTIHFLFDHAPKNILTSGTTVYLYEASHFIATVYIE